MINKMNTTEQKIREHIIQVVNDSQGIKGVELSCKLIEFLILNINKKGDVPVTIYSNYFQNIMDDLVKSGDIIEIEYILPNMSYRIKSMFFPKGTSVCQKD
jgi:hypothetical protein